MIITQDRWIRNMVSMYGESWLVGLCWLGAWTQIPGSVILQPILHTCTYSEEVDFWDSRCFSHDKCSRFSHCTLLGDTQVKTWSLLNDILVTQNEHRYWQAWYCRSEVSEPVSSMSICWVDGLVNPRRACAGGLQKKTKNLWTFEPLNLWTFEQ